MFERTFQRISETYSWAATKATKNISPREGDATCTKAFVERTVGTVPTNPPNGGRYAREELVSQFRWIVAEMWTTPLDDQVRFEVLNKLSQELDQEAEDCPDRVETEADGHEGITNDF